MFAFVLYDFENKLIYLARDRFGEKPCYYSYNGKHLSFSSEIKSLLHLPFIDKQIDKSSLFHQLNFSYIPTEKSIYSSIKNVNPGSYLSFQIINNQVIFNKKTTYWDALNVIKSSVNSKYKNSLVAEQEIESQLNNTITNQLSSDVEVGTFFRRYRLNFGNFNYKKN